MPSTARTTPPQKAGTHPYTMKPGTIFAASRIMAALIKSRNIPKCQYGEGKRDDLEHEAERCVENADHKRCNQGRLQVIHVKSGNEIGHDHECNGAQYPVNQCSKHAGVFLRSLR